MAAECICQSPEAELDGSEGGLVSDFCNKIFVDARIDLTGRFVADCSFDGCILELRKVLGKAGQTTPFPGCVFNNCQLIGDGWPEGWPADRSA
jgi:hypothetical protein